MKTPATGFSVKQLKTKYQVDTMSGCACGTYRMDFQLTCYSCSFTLALSFCEDLESEKPSNLANKLLEKA